MVLGSVCKKLPGYTVWFGTGFWWANGSSSWASLAHRFGRTGHRHRLALGCHRLQPLSEGGMGLGLLYPSDGTYPMGPASGPFGFANGSLVSPMSRIRRRLRIRTFGIPRVPHAAVRFLALILGYQIQRRDGRHDSSKLATHLGT